MITQPLSTRENLLYDGWAPDASPMSASPKLADGKPEPCDERLRVNLSAIDPSGGAAPDAGPYSAAKPSRGVLGGLARAYKAVVPRGGLLASCFSLVSAILGAGIVAIPSAFNLSGIVMALLHLALVALGTVYAMNLLGKVAQSTGAQSYTEATRLLMPPHVDHFIAVLMILICFGGSVSYIISIQTLLMPIFDKPGVPAWLRSKSGNWFLTSMVWLFFMFPLTIPKQINSLRYVSFFGVVVIIYFVVIIVVHSATHGLTNPAIRDEVVFVRTGNAALEGLGVFLFAFLCQINAFEIYHEMEHRTVSNFTLYSILSVGLCAVLYVISGVFGYLDFGDSVTDSILQLYDPVNDPSVAVAYVGLIIKICVGFVLHMIPFRNAIYHFLRLDPMAVSYPKHALVMLVPCTLALLCGLLFPKINTVMGLTGSFCGGILGMIMPALYYMYSGKFSLRSVGLANYLGAYLLLMGGFAAVSFGTVTTVYSTVKNSFG